MRSLIVHAPFWSWVEKNVSTSCETQGADVLCVEVAPCSADSISRPINSPSTGLPSSRVATSSVFGISCCHLPFLSLSICSSLFGFNYYHRCVLFPSGLYQSSAVEPSSAPPFRLHGNTVSDNLQGTVNLVRERRDGATRLAALLLADLGRVCNELFVASATVNGHILIVARLCSRNSQLRKETSRVLSAHASFRSIHDGLNVSRKHLVDRGAETDDLCKVTTSGRELLDRGLGSLDGQS